MNSPTPPSDPKSPWTFPRWTNRLREIGLVAAVGGLLYAVVLLTLLFGPETSAIGYSPEQPVPFSHAIHAGELDIDCRYCHNTVERTARASVPPAQTCMNCHATVKTQSELLEPVRQAAAGGTTLAWKRVHDLPDFVYFDHSSHVGAGVSCVSCHGRVDRMNVVRQEEALTMGWCLNCHRDPSPHLRPREFVTALDWQPSASTPTSQQLVEDYDITPSTDCSTCHR